MTKTTLPLMLAVLCACGPESDPDTGRFAPPGTLNDPAANTRQPLLIIDPTPVPTDPPVSTTPGPLALRQLSPTINFVNTVVTVSGDNLLRPGYAIATRYRFERDTTWLTPTLLSSTQLQVTVPPGSAGGRLCAWSALALSGPPVACTTNSFTVGDPNGRVQVINGSQYSLRSAHLNNVEWLAPAAIAPGAQRTFSPVTPGNTLFTMSLAFGPAAIGVTNREICTYNGMVTVSANTTSTVSVPALNVAQLLGHCGNVDYRANYLDSNGLPRQVTLRFISAANRWEFREGATLLGAGALAVVSWPSDGPAVTFSLFGAGWPNIVALAPFETFVAGPAGDLLLFQRATPW